MQAENISEDKAESGRLTALLPDKDLPKRTALILLVCILVLSSILILTKLGERPFHHDEGVHAVGALKIHRDFCSYGGYDPTYHGPFLFYANALVYHILGVSDFTARLLPALFGIALVAIVYCFNDRLGRGPAVMVAALVAISPIMVYFSRYIRNDIYIAVFSVLVVAGVLKYSKTRRGIHLYLASTALALAFCTKENTYIHAFIFLSFVALWIVTGMTRAAGWLPAISDALKKKWWMIVLAVFLLIFSFWLTGMLFTMRGSQAAIGFALRNELITFFLAVTSVAAVSCSVRFRQPLFVLLVPVLFSTSISLWHVKGQTDLSQQVQLTLSKHYDTAALVPEVMKDILIGKWPGLWEVNGDVRHPLTILPGLRTLGGAYALVLETFPIVVFSFAAFGWFLFLYFWSQERRSAIGPWCKKAKSFLESEWTVLLCAALIFGVIWIVFFTSFFRLPDQWNGFTKAFDYWWYQHKIQRVKGPKWYHFPRLATYEFMMLTATTAAFRRLWKRRNVLFLFFVYWTLAAGAAYTYAGEKVPWLTVHIVTPLTFLGGISIWELTTASKNRVRKSVWRVIFILLAAFTFYNTVRASFIYPSPYWDEHTAKEKGLEKPERNHFELTNYVQTSAHLIKIMRNVENAAKRTGLGHDLPMICYGDATWPLSWYLRDYTRVYWSRDAHNVEAAVILGDWSDKNDIARAVGSNYDSYRYHHRSWWLPPPPMDFLFGTRPYRHASFGEGRAKRFISGAKDILRYFFTREIYSELGSTDICMFVQKDLKRTLPIQKVDLGEPCREYENPPGFIKPVVTWGEKGNGRGQFDEPRGIAIAPDDSVYVVDSKNGRVQKFSSKGEFLLEWGESVADKTMKTAADLNPLPHAGRFHDPNGIAVDRNGDVYVADTWNHRIQKFDCRGRYLLQWQGSHGHFHGPRGIAVAGDGTVLLTDTGNKRVVRYSSKGEFINTWGAEGSAPGQFIEPVGIAVDSVGCVYVADTVNHRVQVFDIEGRFQKEIPVSGWGVFHTEPHVAVTKEGYVIVTDSFENQVAVYDAHGRNLMNWGGEGTQEGRFSHPIGIAVAEDGNVFVTDAFNGRVQVFRPMIKEPLTRTKGRPIENP